MNKNKEHEIGFKTHFKGLETYYNKLTDNNNKANEKIQKQGSGAGGYTSDNYYYLLKFRAKNRKI